MTAAVDAPANPICLTCISVLFAGAEENFSTFAATVYALATLALSGYWSTPSIVTNTFSLFGGTFDKLNSVVLPSPVKLSTVLSEISKVTLLLVNTWAQKISVDAGAWDKTIVPSKSNPNPVLGVAVSCGCCMTPLIDITNCAYLVIFAFTPFVWVALNFVLTPSNATFNVWEDPPPTPVILIATPFDALLAVVANFIVWWSCLIT